jgi:HAD superfamily hydrolase (TIGR01509 family)
MLTRNRHDADYLLCSKRRALALLLHGQPPPLVDGVQEFIISRRVRGVTLAIASNSSRDRIVQILDRYGLTHHFEVIAAARGVCPPKPSPGIYVSIIKALRLPPRAVVAIEDSICGIQSAKSAGLTVIGIGAPSASSIPKGLAHATVADFSELYSELKRS